MKEMAGGVAASLDVDLEALSQSRDDGIAVSGTTRDVADTAARTVVIALFTVMAARLGMDYMQTGRLTGLLLLASEALIVVLTLFRRAPACVDRTAQARLLTACSMLGQPFVRPTAVEGLAPEVLTVLISTIGLLVVIGGKLSLGRSFGLMPANRGIVSSGLYRIVRHPIYLGYLVTHVAFILANPTIWNTVLLVTADVALLARAVREERTLSLDEEYRQYRQVVRWRVVPGLF
jgi:protein-S-isoprenylcysteine O-methyltransferase Ste14